MSIGSHQSPVNKSDVWLTPRPILDALGQFDLDPCAAPEWANWPTAKQMIRLPQDGLSIQWDGRVWMNPPYGGPGIIGPWMRKMVGHGKGIALIFARTETELFFECGWRAASAMLFLEGRLHFHYPWMENPAMCEVQPHQWAKVTDDPLDKAIACRNCGMAKANAGAPSVLIAYGDEDREVLAEALLPGQFVPLQLPRSYIMYALACSWREAVLQWVKAHDGPVRVSDLYEALADHPKVRGKKHWREKIRQTLQRGPFEKVGRGEWVAA